MISPELAERYRFDMNEGLHEATAQRAFNLGSDARLDGLLLNDCPFPPGGTPWSYWRAGWEDVETHWAIDSVNGRAKQKRKVERL